MPIHNADIAAVFETLADLLELQNANPFRVRAYRNAARTVQGMGPDIKAMADRGEDLTELPGIGKDLAGKIQEILTTGTCSALTELQKELPPSLVQLLKIPGLGPKRVGILYHQLHLTSPDELYEAARAGRIRDLHGFGERTELHLLQTLEQRTTKKQRVSLAIARQYAEPLAAMLKTLPGVQQVAIAGSYRRAKETVGDVDIVVSAHADSPVMNRFVTYDDVGQVISQGDTRSSVVLKSGLQVDLRLVEDASFGAALHYFTGSKAHNIVVRRLAQQRGLKINEYGIFRGRKRVGGETEASVFASVDLVTIPPELRENQGEIEAARKGSLPTLIERADLRGDLHAHSRATDGHNTLEELGEAARARGLAYLAITEHSRRVTVAHGLDPTQLRRHLDAIERANARLKGITLLKGIEVDILEDGALDLPDSVLKELDIVVGAIHSHFDLSRKKQTERILRAMDHRYFSLLAHPSGRLIGEREPMDVDMLRIVRHARQRGCFLELNANPARLDLMDVYCRMAKDEGVLVAINSDAHSVVDFDNLDFGIGQGRRGWLEARDVVNTRNLVDIRRLLRQTMQHAQAGAAS